MRNIIVVNFEQGKMEANAYDKVWQYDYGQTLRIQGLKLPRNVEIHFATQRTGGIALPRVGVTRDGVTDVIIPDSMLENGDATSDYPVYAFVYLTDETSGQTEYMIRMQVKSRPRPEVPGGSEDPGAFHEAVREVRKLTEKATESERQAEGWAHGREDLPERAEDNAKYYAGQAAADAKKTGTDRKEVERLVKSVSGIDEQVTKVQNLAGQAQTSATNAALSEQAAKTAETNAKTAQTAAETAEVHAKSAEQGAKASEQAAEKAKQLVAQMGQEVLDNKNHVDQTVQTFNLTAQKALADVNSTGQTQTERVQSAGNTAVESVKTEQGKATQAVETAKMEAVKAVQTEGTTQTGNVSAEGEKQVRAVSTEGQKQLDAVNLAVQGIVADREQIKTNKDNIAQLKGALADTDNKVQTLQNSVGGYTDRFFQNYFALQRTGKKYTVKFHMWETSQVSTGEKLDDNVGLVIEPSTLTEKGRDDYENIPLFRTYDCNVEKIDGNLKITAMKGDANFDSKEKDTFVLGMPYYEKAWVQDGYLYLSRSDTPHEGYVLCPEARKENGMRNFCLYAKYMAGRNSTGTLGSYADVNPARKLPSYNANITEAKKRGNEYAFSSSYDLKYIQNTFLIKYADKNWNKILGGDFSYSLQYKVSLPETDAKRVVLKKAEAERYHIGSYVSVGEEYDPGKAPDRNRDEAHSLCDSVEILDIVEVDVENKALVLDIPNTITTTATTWVSTMHWRSGFSNKIKGIDGCACETKSQISSLHYPSVIQGIECMVGGYEVLGNTFMDIVDGTHRDVYVCNDSTKLTTDVNTAKQNYIKLPKQMSVDKNSAWQYITEMSFDVENGMNIITQAGVSGSGSNTGYADGVYLDAAITGQREFLCFGALRYGTLNGIFCVSGDSGLSSAAWHVLARLSLNVFRGEFA